MADRRYEDDRFSYGAIAYGVLATIWMIGIESQLIAKHVTHGPPPPVKAAAAPAPAAKTEPPAAAPAAAPAPAAATAGNTKLALPGGTEIDASGTGIESQLLGFITDPAAPIDKKNWFDFDRLNFETGSAKLTADSKAQVDNIAAILKAYPAVKIKIKIGGYTDNVGNPESNLSLSGARAKTVAETLTVLGIAADRVEHEGYASSTRSQTTSPPMAARRTGGSL